MSTKAEILEGKIVEIGYQEELFNNNDAFDARPRRQVAKTGRGRKPGEINHRTTDLKQYCADVIGLISPEQTALDIMNMTPYERQRIILSYMDYVVPKLQRLIVQPTDEVDKTIVIELPNIVEMSKSEAEPD